MRHSLALVLLLAAAPLPAAAAPASPAHSSAILLRVHPAAWRPLAAPPRMAGAAGMTLVPDTGEAGAPFAPTPGGAARRAASPAPVRTAADGSRHAVLGGSIRAYTVVSLDAQGNLVQDCVHSETEALRRIGAAPAAPAAGPGPAKTEDR